jgi:hypothetical protein
VGQRRSFLLEKRAAGVVKLTSACRGLGRVAPYLARARKVRLFMRLGALEWLHDRRGPV